jgi:hypothetical protein
MFLFVALLGNKKCIYFVIQSTFKYKNMHSSQAWIEHYRANALNQRIDWTLAPTITPKEVHVIRRSLQAWQLGETSDGNNLIRAASRYALRIDDPDYLKAILLFIKEEQKHGANLGRYLDGIGEKRIQKDWGDTLFRKVRHLNTSMESWTLAVLVVESTAQVFYQALKNATACPLLRQICTDILIDEAHHINFQTERTTMLFYAKKPLEQWLSRPVYKCFFFGVALLVWFANRRLFRAGGNSFKTYFAKMRYKYYKTLYRAMHSTMHSASLGSAMDDPKMPYIATK